MGITNDRKPDPYVQAALEITTRRRLRREAARDLRHTRAVMRNVCGETLIQSSYSWWYYANRRQQQFKDYHADPRRMRIERSYAARFGYARFGPIVLDDGYACCGEEDARGDRQEDARREARTLTYALRLLTA